jgi:FkbM family methyltransferase
VIAIEPEPLNAECLRRNFAAEITLGKVIVVPEGVWSSDGSFPLRINSTNPAGHRMAIREVSEKTIDVPVSKIDTRSFSVYSCLESITSRSTSREPSERLCRGQ